MDTVIAAPASCEVRAVIRFLHAEGQSIYSYTTRRKCMRVCVQQKQKFLVTTERVLWRYDNAFTFTNQSEVDFGITLVIILHAFVASLDSSVRVVSRLRDGRKRNQLSIPCRDKNLLTFTGYNGIFPRTVKRTENEADHSPRSRAEVKTKWICTSNLP